MFVSSFSLNPTTKPLTMETFNENENELIDDCYVFINELAIEAGKLVKEGFLKTKNVDYKTSSFDLVMEYHGRCEDFLIGEINCKYPDHTFIVEDPKIKPELTDEPTWVIDSIDGNTNYVHGIPLIAISIAFVLKKQLVIGVVYNPILDEHFKCRLRQGAYLNNERIHCSKTETLRESIYAHEVSLAAVEWVRDKNMKRVYKFASLARGLRSLGSAALTLAYVAKGCIDGYQIDDVKPWDVAAGALLIREAGGVVYKTDGTDFDFMNSYLVCAGTEKLCQELIDGIKETNTWNAIKMSQSSDENLTDECYSLGLDLVRKAGTLVKEGFEQLTKTVNTKSGSWDLVTEYDAKVEQLLINGITNKYPDHHFIAEETKANEILTDAPTWIIDPIDGTNNFVHGIPFTAISVAFVLKKKLQIGIVYNPIMNEMYTARLGQGAFLNDKKIAVSNTKTLDESIYCQEVSLARIEGIRDKHMKRVYKFAASCQGVRAFGCAALTLSYVARGSIDCYHIEDLYPWDVAAGALLVQEAGGKIYKSNGAPYEVMDTKIVCAGNDQLCKEAIETLNIADKSNLRME